MRNEIKGAVLFLGLLALLAVFTAAIQGCAASARTTPPGASATKTIEQRAPDGSVTRTTISGSASGTGQSASGSKVDAEMDSEPASVALDDVLATGGGGRGRTQAKADSNLMTRLAAGAGGVICLLGAGGLIYFGRVRGGLVVGAVGAGCIAIALWPGLLSWVLVGALVAVVGPYVYAEWKAKGSHEGLRAALEAVNGLGEQARQQFADLVRSHAVDADANVIRKVKRADTLDKVPV